jgi:TPR repeat protein
VVKFLLALSVAAALFFGSVQNNDVMAADFADGVAAYHAEDYETAFEAWLPLAEEGDNAAQYNIGILYQFGLGVAQDVQKAVEWYQKSAEAGFADATAHMGDLYAKGFFGVPDDASAIIWYERASKQGHAEAATKLAAARARMIPEVPDTGNSAVPNAQPAISSQ